MAIANADRRFDALLLLGDNVYPNGDPARLGTTVFGPFAPLLDGGAALLAVLGNHDVEAQLRPLAMPGRWYARSLGPVLFIGLDSNRPDDPAQRAWLEQTLAGASEPWRIVALHHPPYSAGWHGSSAKVRDAFAPLFERYGGPAGAGRSRPRLPALHPHPGRDLRGLGRGGQATQRPAAPTTRRRRGPPTTSSTSRYGPASCSCGPLARTAGSSTPPPSPHESVSSR